MRVAFQALCFQSSMFFEQLLFGCCKRLFLLKCVFIAEQNLKSLDVFSRLVLMQATLYSDTLCKTPSNDRVPSAIPKSRTRNTKGKKSKKSKR